MRLPSLKKIFLKIERPAIYGLIVAIILLEMIASIFPNIAQQIPPSVGVMSVLSVSLLAFRYIDDRLQTIDSDISSLERGEKLKTKGRFSEAIDELFTHYETVEKVDFIGSSSGSFLPAIKARNVEIETARIMIRNPDSSFRIPSHPEMEENLDNRIEDQLRDWQAMYNDGSLGEIRVKGYSIEPVIFGIVVNEERGAFGWFEPSQEHPYFHVMNTHVMQSDDGSIDPILQDFNRWFNLMFAEYSITIWDSEIDE